MSYSQNSRHTRQRQQRVVTISSLIAILVVLAGFIAIQSCSQFGSRADDEQIDGEMWTVSELPPGCDATTVYVVTYEWPDALSIVCNDAKKIRIYTSANRGGDWIPQVMLK